LSELILVSNRGPVTYHRDATGTRYERRGAGGLSTALRGLLDRADVTWIASAMTEEDRAVAAEGGTLVAHDPEAYRLYYEVVSNPMLWFVQHDLWNPPLTPVIDHAFHRAWHDGYARVNRAFADAVIAQLDEHPRATVFFQDYHLYLAPRMVRAARPDAKLAHFVHIPWPADWSLVPHEIRYAVHDGLLANDVVSFHTARWCRNFRHSCRDVCGEGSRTLVTHHGISIDVDEFERLAASDEVRAHEARLPRPEKLIVRVDRTDPSKNIVRGFAAFGMLLDEHPEWRGRVSMLARLDPSRESIREYVEYREAIEREVAAVNARHPSAIQLEIADDFPRSVAAYKQFDVLLVNAVFDGMNLVAKEGPLVNARDGVLVLSENAGAHEELGEWALTVNPYDVYGQAEALHEALGMDVIERRRRLDAIRDHVRRNDVGAWLDALLQDVERI
jgi:trehalose 6-phosphate synthase